METEFDSRKDAANLAKHGASLADARRLDWDTLWPMDDRRRPYGEQRMIGYALMGDRLFCVVFADRHGVRRIISLRKANNREIARYAEVSDTP
ncbi:MAG: BrnT family toxin [Pseudomonadota bacterium]